MASVEYAGVLKLHFTIMTVTAGQKILKDQHWGSTIINQRTLLSQTHTRERSMEIEKDRC